MGLMVNCKYNSINVFVLERDTAKQSQSAKSSSLERQTKRGSSANGKNSSVNDFIKQREEAKHRIILVESLPVEKNKDSSFKHWNT